jgi:arylsulfatase
VSQLPPNIIYILADDLGYGELGIHGQTLIETPHIDSLAESGMRFTQHYSGSPVCAPSRCVLMTGKHTGHAHIRGNDEWAERGDVWDFAKAVEDPNLEGQRPLPRGTQTLGRVLQGVGYQTAIVGKWGLGAPLTEGIPNEQGFDLFYGYNCQRQAHTYFPRHLWKNREKVWLENEIVPPRTALEEGADPEDPASYARFSLAQYAPDLMQTEALQFIQDNKDQPFFLYYATPIPHLPLQAPRKWVDYYREKLGPESPYIGNKGYFPALAPRATYAAQISYLDDKVGELVETLEELGIRDRTLILFSSDNGPTYTGGADTVFFDSARPFKTEYGWGKGFLHEGGVRVPMIANWPGHIEPGSSTGHISAFWDVLPTLAEIAGAPVPDDIDGISFAPTLRGESASQKQHEFLYWEFPAYEGQQAVRIGPWKGIRKNIFDGNMTVELYHLEDDPREEHDVAGQHPDIIAEIEAIMMREHVPATIERFKIKELGDK